jgi:hypothetical protein
MQENEDLTICFEIIHLFTLRYSIIDGLEPRSYHGVQMNAHDGFSIFAHEQNRIVSDTLDDIDGSLPFVPEFLAGFYDEDAFLYHGTTLSE